MEKSQILSSMKLLRHDAVGHVTAFANQTQRQDKLGTEKKPKRKDLTKTLKLHKML